MKFLYESTEAMEACIIMRALGEDHNLSRAKSQIHKMVELEQFETQYNGGIFTSKQIKALCIRYDMRILPSRYYKGNIDLEVLSKIQEFSKQTGILINDGTLSTHFYILAPTESFTLKRVRMERYSDDSIIFYKINGDKWKLIHKWGSDFIVFRLIRGLYGKNSKSRLGLVFLTSVLIIFTMLLIADTIWGISNWRYFFILLALIPLLGDYIWLDNLRYEEQAYSEKSWDKSDKFL